MSSRSLITMIEHIEPGIVILNSDYSISHFNRMFLLMFEEIPADRLILTNILGFHHEKNRVKVADKLRLAKNSNRQIPLSLKIISRDGQDRYLQVKLTPLVDLANAEDKLCATFYDITPFVSVGRKLLRVPVISGGEIHLLKLEEIIYLKADNIYSQVYAESGVYHCDLTIGAIAKRLPENMFIRSHRSYLLNISKINKVQRERSECTVRFMGNDVRLPISRGRLHEFLNEFGLK
jgi:DNA-binding LytR/AlgR family response regulator